MPFPCGRRVPVLESLIEARLGTCHAVEVDDDFEGWDGLGRIDPWCWVRDVDTFSCITLGSGEFARPPGMDPVDGRSADRAPELCAPE